MVQPRQTCSGGRLRWAYYRWFQTYGIKGRKRKRERGRVVQKTFIIPRQLRLGKVTAYDTNAGYHLENHVESFRALFFIPSLMP